MKVLERGINLKGVACAWIEEPVDPAGHVRQEGISGEQTGNADDPERNDNHPRDPVQKEQRRPRPGQSAWSAQSQAGPQKSCADSKKNEGE
jgi:hypothetical protein